MTPLDQQQQQRQQAAADLLAHESQLDPEKAVDRAEVDGELEAATAEGVSDEPYAIYRRFPPRQKALYAALVSFAAFLAPMASAAFFPSIPTVAADMGTSGEVINYLCVALYIAVLGIVPLVWAPLSGYYGRRPIYLVSIPIFVAGSLGCGFSNSLGALVACRVLQAIGSSSVLSVGAGTMGDLYSPLERASAMGLFYIGVLAGPSFGPLIAGILQEYTSQGWKATQFLLAALGALSWVLTTLFMPETWHGPTPHALACETSGRRFVVYRFNPFRAVGLLKHINILLISLNSSFILLTTYCLVVPLSYTLAPRFNITNSAILGTLFVPIGVGNIVGSRLGGLYADWTVAKWIAKRGYRRPEDRLYSTLVGGGLLVPGSMIAVGWLTETAKGGLAPVLVFYFISGLGLMFVLSSSNTYCVDCLQSRSAEVIAINNCLRYIAAAGASAGILPLVKAVGVGPANSLFAGIGLLGFVCVLAVIRWGEAMSGRAVPDGATATTTKVEAEPTATTSGTSTNRPLSPTSSVKGFFVRKDDSTPAAQPSSADHHTANDLSASSADLGRVGRHGVVVPGTAFRMGAVDQKSREVEAESLRDLARTVSLH